MSAATWLRVFHFAPAPHARWPVALQAGLALAVPLFAFTLAGRQDLGLLASAGAFAAVYAGAATTRERAKVLPVVTAVVFASALAGGWAAGTAWALPGMIVVSIAVSVFCYAFSLGPPGPLFFVLVYGLAGNIRAPHGDAPPMPLGEFAVVLAVGCVAAYAIAVSALVLPRVRRRPARPLRELLAGPSLAGERGVLLLRAAIVTVVGAVAGAWFVDPSRAYWAVCSGLAIVGVAAGRRIAVERGAQRLIGTLVGVGVFALVAGIPISIWVLPLVLGGLQFVVELLIVRNYAAALVFITPLVLLLVTAAAPGADPGGLIAVRAVDTAIGAIVGSLSALLHPRRPA